jgi:hypothetical protein
MKIDKKIIGPELNMLLSELYGKQLHYEISIKFVDYQKTLLKIINTVEKAIKENISDTDEYHKKVLFNRIESIKSSNKSTQKRKETFEQSIIAQLFEIIFLLMGELPNNIGRSLDGKKELTNSHHWILNRYRNIVYTQSYAQKKNLIFDYYSLGANSNSKIKKNYLSKKYIEFKQSDRHFISWFKTEHPVEYISIF